jgi:hypothetical protein
MSPAPSMSESISFFSTQASIAFSSQPQIRRAPRFVSKISKIILMADCLFFVFFQKKTIAMQARRFHKCFLVKNLAASTVIFSEWKKLI